MLLYVEYTLVHFSSGFQKGKKSATIFARVKRRGYWKFLEALLWKNEEEPCVRSDSRKRNNQFLKLIDVVKLIVQTRSTDDNFYVED